MFKYFLAMTLMMVSSWVGVYVLLKHPHTSIATLTFYLMPLWFILNFFGFLSFRVGNALHYPVWITTVFTTVIQFALSLLMSFFILHQKPGHWLGIAGGMLLMVGGVLVLSVFGVS